MIAIITCIYTNQIDKDSFLIQKIKFNHRSLQALNTNLYK